ncbi:MAG TPA: ABC transporter ATP-binding protein [Acidimicrobiales bacterium]|nr:ABC transporter ATP-binding protein [Acidimicrobiales bacterium]
MPEKPGAVATTARRRRRASADGSSPGGPALLQLEAIDFSYGPLQVLHGVDLEVWDGEIVALVGTNGAGKSTLLRVAAGLDRPGRGRVLLEGRDVTDVPAEDRVALGVGLLLGGRSLFSDLSVDENLRVAATTVRRSPDLEDRLAEMFALFPRLADRRRQAAASLSGGEQQMLALAKVLLLRPRLLMIDELSLGLAPVIVADLLEVLRRVRDGGTTIVVVEQSVAVAAEIADRAVHMEKGAIRFVGAPRQLMEAEVARSVFFGGDPG